MSLLSPMRDPEKKTEPVPEYDWAEIYLQLGASQENRQRFEKRREAIAENDNGWALAQNCFLQEIREFLEQEIQRNPSETVGMHEAGGQFRVGFPYYYASGDERLKQAMLEYLRCQREYGKTLYHGFGPCEEVHHQIETFIYFQYAMLYLIPEARDLALESIEDVAHHLGNWADGVPDWYDWDRHQFVSVWLGTREVRNYPPFDYQEANHFRFLDAAIAIHLATGDQKYLDLAIDYCDAWTRKIEQTPEGRPVTCQIVPENAIVEEHGSAASRPPDTQAYRIFYNIVADNTAFEVSSTLLDMYRITGNDRYLAAARRMTDQFFENGDGARPAEACTDAGWGIQYRSLTVPRPGSSTFSARFALKHDSILGDDRYRDAVIRFADDIDEHANLYDIGLINPLVAAHYYTGDPSYLSHALDMALRVIEVTRKDSHPRDAQCRWNDSASGSKMLMSTLFQPLFGAPEWGTRGNTPFVSFTHRAGEETRLPESVSFRVWRDTSRTDHFEAVNLGDREVAWSLEGRDRALDHVEIRGTPVAQICLEPGARAVGRVVYG